MRLNGTGDLIDRLEYPVTSEELIDDHGHHNIELQAGDETLGEVLARSGGETFDSPTDLRTEVYNCVSHKAIGRRFYSDRDPTTIGESGPTPLSL